MDLLHRIVLAAAASAISGPAPAVSAVTTSGALGATDFIDWAQLGPDLRLLDASMTVSTNLGGPVMVDSESGLRAHGTAQELARQFHPRATPCSRRAVAGPDISIAFAAPLAGVGTQWQASAWCLPCQPQGL